MKVNIEQAGFKMEVSYNDDGRLMYVTNLESGKKMMLQKFEDGDGYTIKENTFMMTMDVCDARYFRVMDADLFIPNFIFIQNRKK